MPTRIAVAAIVLFSLLSAGRFVFAPVKPFRPAGLPLPQYEKRFEKLRKRLPQRGVVGYLGVGWDSRYRLPAYYATQYALAPVVVENSLEPELVVGNFAAPLDPTTTTWPANLFPVQSFGDGVVLLAKRRN
ncbi:MAG: hypothetical protein DMG69_02470 [Acidobacteria bacterium]|nr:MAG: hypothetical protein DMG69_02470 [Acidobacteriota bacterium]